MELLAVSVFLAILISTATAYDFYVGGRDGWVEKPSESYSQWAGRMRFQVHDKLVFKYKKGEDTVLVVKKEDYDSCNTSNPIAKLDDGNSTFRFEHSGPFYFVSGADGKCAKGQKLIVVVMAERKKETAPSPSPSTMPPATSTPPSVSPSAPSPPIVSPAVSPVQSPSWSGSEISAFSPAASPAQSSSAFALTVSSVFVGVLVVLSACVVV